MSEEFAGPLLLRGRTVQRYKTLYSKSLVGSNLVLVNATAHALHSIILHSIYCVFLHVRAKGEHVSERLSSKMRARAPYKRPDLQYRTPGQEECESIVEGRVRIPEHRNSLVTR